MNDENINPLFDTQREKAGSQTKQKYSFQYHWALYRILDEHKEKNEYAVFVELHEDVIITNSLSAEDATFEFNQVKTSKGKFNTHQLVKQKNGNSVLGKLIDSGNNKSFSKKIKSLNLVALNDFNLDLKKVGVRLDKITLKDLESSQIQSLQEAIFKELNIVTLPEHLQFIVPSLSEKNFSHDVIASIAELIDGLFPESYCNPVEIYRLLIDEINKKGEVTYDFKNWDELLNKKALTSITVTKVINDFTNLKDEAKIQADFNDICLELNLKIIEKSKLKRAFSRYRSLRISNASTLQIDTTKGIVNLINDNISKGIVEISILIENVTSKLSDKIKNQFVTNEDLKSAIICEFIMMN